MTSVYGATVLVLGMGDIGGEFGMRCKALGAKVIGVRRSPRPARTMPTRFICWRTGSAAAPGRCGCRYLPGTEATRGLMDRERLAKMKEARCF